MSPSEVRRRLLALRRDQRHIDRAIRSLETLQTSRLGRVVELVPHAMVMEAQRRHEARRLRDLLAA
jgi:hypothetical protein